LRGSALLRAVLVGDRAREASTGPEKMGEKEEYLIPQISQHDYHAFRRLISTDLPKTYKEWHWLMEQARLENESRKIIVRTIEINFQEFARYC
jgi:hypothetical protein